MRKRLGYWGSKGFWAVMDQGLFAVSNFALNVLLARWLTPVDYGAFSVAYTLFLLLGTFHTAIFTEPMLIFGSAKHQERLGSYLAVLLRGHWLFGAFAALLFALAGLGLWQLASSPLAPAFFGLGVAAPFILFQWLARRACYINLQPHLAAASGALYMLLMAAGIFVLYSTTWLNAATALAVMAIASLVSGGVILQRLGVVRRTSPDMVSDVQSDHWRYGRWAVGIAVLMWIPGNAFILILPAWWGLEASAAYRAILNLLLPVMNVTMALGSVLLPSLVRMRTRRDLGRIIARLVLIFMLLPLVYWLILGFWGEELTRLAYDGMYGEYVTWLWLAGMIPLVAAAANVMGAVLRALELPNKVLVAYGFSATTALTVGLPLIYVWGVVGALVGWLIAYLVTMVSLGVQLKRQLRHTPLANET